MIAPGKRKAVKRERRSSSLKTNQRVRDSVFIRRSRDVTTQYDHNAVTAR